MSRRKGRKNGREERILQKHEEMEGEEGGERENDEAEARGGLDSAIFRRGQAKHDHDPFPSGDEKTFTTTMVYCRRALATEI